MAIKAMAGTVSVFKMKGVVKKCCQCGQSLSSTTSTCTELQVMKTGFPCNELSSLLPKKPPSPASLVCLSCLSHVINYYNFRRTITATRNTDEEYSEDEDHKIQTNLRIVNKNRANGNGILKWKQKKHWTEMVKTNSVKSQRMSVENKQTLKILPSSTAIVPHKEVSFV